MSDYVHGYHWTHPVCGHRIPLSVDPEEDLAVPQYLLSELNLPKPGEVGDPFSTYANPSNLSYLRDKNPNGILPEPDGNYRKAGKNEWVYGGFVTRTDPGIEPTSLTHPHMNRDKDLNPHSANLLTLQRGSNQGALPPSSLDLGWPGGGVSCPICERSKRDAEFDQLRGAMEKAASQGGDWAAKVKELSIALQKKLKAVSPIPNVKGKGNIPFLFTSVFSPADAEAQDHPKPFLPARPQHPDDVALGVAPVSGGARNTGHIARSLITYPGPDSVTSSPSKTPTPATALSSHQFGDAITSSRYDSDNLPIRTPFSPPAHERPISPIGRARRGTDSSRSFHARDTVQSAFSNLAIGYQHAAKPSTGSVESQHESNAHTDRQADMNTRATNIATTQTPAHRGPIRSPGAGRGAGRTWADTAAAAAGASAAPSPAPTSALGASPFGAIGTPRPHRSWASAAAAGGKMSSEPGRGAKHSGHGKGGRGGHGGGGAARPPSGPRIPTGPRGGAAARSKAIPIVNPHSAAAGARSAPPKRGSFAALGSPDSQDTSSEDGGVPI